LLLLLLLLLPLMRLMPLALLTTSLFRDIGCGTGVYSDGS